MKALLLKKWGGYFAGQVLTGYDRGSLPAEAVVWYEDDETVPQLPVINDSIDPASPELAQGSRARPAAAKKVSKAAANKRR